MDVSVVESRQQQAAVEIDDFRVGAGELTDRCVVADGEDLVAVKRDRMRDRQRGILGPDFAVDQNQAGFFGVRCGTANAQGKKDEYTKQQLRLELRGR